MEHYNGEKLINSNMSSTELEYPIFQPHHVETHLHDVARLLDTFNQQYILATTSIVQSQDEIQRNIELKQQLMGIVDSL